MNKNDTILVHSDNMEALHDFAQLFPADLMGNYTGWMWWVDDMKRFHLTQDTRGSWMYAPNDEKICGYLDVMFEGDGVVIFSLYTSTDNVKIARGLYDSHCLDNGAKFRRFMDIMDPRSRKFSTTLKDALKAYDDAYWKNEDGYDGSIVIGQYDTIDMH